MPLTHSLTLFLFRGPSPEAAPPPAIAPPRRGPAKMWNFQSLLDAAGVTLRGGGARNGDGRPSLTNCPGPFLILSTNVGNMAEKRRPLLGFVGKLPSGTAAGNSGKTHCPLCRGLFEAPRLLPCLHTVCTTCLEQLEPFSVVDIRGGESDTSSEGSIFQELKPRALQPQIGILCPVCDAQVDLPMGGVKALIIDHLAMNDVMLESLRGEGQGLVCDLCSDREVEKRCQTCKANLCHFCCQAHRRQKKTTYHTMVDLKDLKGYSQIGKPILCPAHPAEELRLFCELCDRPVCRDCVVGEHREHPCDFTSNVIHKHEDSVRELLRGTQPHMEALEEALAQIKGTNSVLQERVKAVAADIHTFSEGYIKAIEEHRDKLLKQLEDIRVQKENSLQLQKAQLEQLLADMRTGVEFTEHLLASGSDLEILITKGVVVERLTKLNKVEYSAHPGVNEKIAFSPKEKAGLCRGYEVYGAINTKEVDPAKCVLQGEDLHRAREKQPASFTVLCKDATGESMGRGGDNVQVTVVPKDKKDSPVKTMVHDNKDGTYYVSYTPKEPGTYTVLVCVKEQHVQGSPFTVTVRKRHRSHPGVFHCCTFCSSGGQKTARCACGGTMPGGYLGCGHGHKGHPGRPHWSCCGKFTEKSECTWAGGQSGPWSLLRTVAF